MLLSISAPGHGFSVTLDGHTWIFDRDAIIVGSLPPPKDHLGSRSPENCPACLEFMIRSRGHAR
jgi:hypothetical protein